jgi:hypothetical protein
MAGSVCRVSDDAVRRFADDAACRFADDSGGIVLGWVTRLVLFFSVAGVVLFDAISIGTTAMTVADQGSTAAQAASDAWQTGNKDVQTAYDAAVASAAEQNKADVIATKDFKVDADGTVHLTVSRTAATLIVYRIGPIKSWAYVERHAQARSVN